MDAFCLLLWMLLHILSGLLFYHVYVDHAAVEYLNGRLTIYNVFVLRGYAQDFLAYHRQQTRRIALF